MPSRKQRFIFYGGRFRGQDGVASQPLFLIAGPRTVSNMIPNAQRRAGAVLSGLACPFALTLALNVGAQPSQADTATPPLQASSQTGSGLEERLATAGSTVLKRDRIYSAGYATWIWPHPTKVGRKLGYVRVGQSVPLRSGVEPVKGHGCPRGFYPVQPRGWVCLDRSATLDPFDRYVAAMALSDPADEPLPFNYALSNGTPMYKRLPSKAEWTKTERFLGPAGAFKPLSWGNRGHEKLAEVREVPARDALPSFLERGGAAGTSQPLRLVRRTIPLGSMLAYTKSFEHEGRTFLLSADGTVVPADRVRPFRESRFEGLKLTAETTLPLAWVREQAKPRYRLDDAGGIERSAEQWALRGAVPLAAGADPIEHEGTRYLKTRQLDSAGRPWLIAEADATVVEAAAKLPFGISAQEKWIQVSLSRGTLVAYQGLEPVYATLQSPGVGGIPRKGVDPVKASTTPLGIYRITYKHRAATMSPEQGENRSFWIADVPYTQYFHAPFALHVAYWHENFGEGMSAGCVNLSPRDGRWLFGWTDPQVPPGWNGARSGGDNGKGTWVVVRR